ncbi:hypothetical protein L218DRAFT_919673 [Marasmius fiardii PR-910]|nr:hypothetical protein L218DRAFT_919673 [Marasmius fiardii PR-910]
MNGWHPGEVIIRQKLSYNLDPSTHILYTAIYGDLDPDHAVFHTTRLPFLPVTTVDEGGRPWGSILAAEDGEPGDGQGFIAHPRYTVLTVNTKVWVGDPLIENIKAHSFDPSTGIAQEGGNDMLIAGIGIEFPTRRRNKFAGKITKMNVTSDNHIDMEIFVNESIGNCPKYINVRSLTPHPNASPRIKYQVANLSSKERLPDEVIAFIQGADTVFLGSTYKARDLDKVMFPSHVGMNQRGGRPGFIRVKPSDGRTVVLPDYSGNRIMTSLGNIEASGLASLTFLSWTTGDILYLTGTARNLVGSEARKVMAFQRALTEIQVTGFTYVEDALTVRQTPGTVPQRSPYSPPVQLLAEEQASTQLFADPGSEDEVKATLARIDLHSPTVATFTWEASKELDIKPGQAIILDLKPFLGSVPYYHMAPGKPSSINDDRIRTWTVSSANSTNKKTFDTTMKLKEGGAATTALFSISYKLKEIKPEMCADTRDLGLNVRVVGVTGEFCLPTKVEKMLWIAGGIGVTPFLSMLKGLGDSSSGQWDITLLLSTREPEVLLPLISAIQVEAQRRVKLTVVVFSKAPFYDADIPVERHTGRLTSHFFSDSSWLSDTKERSVYLCGPAEFEEFVVEELRRIGTPTSSIRREQFVY